jgi:hypothetical protein
LTSVRRIVGVLDPSAIPDHPSHTVAPTKVAFTVAAAVGLSVGLLFALGAALRDILDLPHWKGEKWLLAILLFVVAGSAGEILHVLERTSARRHGAPPVRLLGGAVAGILAALTADIAYKIGEWLPLEIFNGLLYVVVAAVSTYGWAYGMRMRKAPLYGAGCGAVAGLGAMLIQKLLGGATVPWLFLEYAVLGMAGGLAITVGRKPLAALTGVVVAFGLFWSFNFFWSFYAITFFRQLFAVLFPSPLQRATALITVALSPAVAATAWIVVLFAYSPGGVLFAPRAARGTPRPARPLPVSDLQAPAVTRPEPMFGPGVPLPPAPRPAWTVGDTWRYRDFTGTPFELKVVGVSADHYAIEKKTGPRSDMLRADLDCSSDWFARFQWPLEIGRQWLFEGRQQAGGGRTYNYATEFAVEAGEAVTVPAGTFDAFRIHGRQCNTDLNQRGDFFVWYAVATKTWVKISWFQQAYWGDRLSGRSTELVSHQLQSMTYPA